MVTEVGTKEFLDWNIGQNKRFRNLTELLEELTAIRVRFGGSVGFAGGPIDEEIEIVEKLINDAKHEPIEDPETVRARQEAAIEEANKEIDKDDHELGCTESG